MTSNRQATTDTMANSLHYRTCSWIATELKYSYPSVNDFARNHSMVLCFFRILSKGDPHQVVTITSTKQRVRVYIDLQHWPVKQLLGHLQHKRTKHLQHLQAIYYHPWLFPANPMPQSETILCSREEEEVWFPCQSATECQLVSLWTGITTRGTKNVPILPL
jgi:hypothetical protein